MTIREFSYLTGTLVLATGLWHVSGRAGLERLSRWKPPARLANLVSVTAVTLTLLLILDEVGLLLAEWDLPAGPLAALRDLQGLPGVSQLLCFANLALVAPATLSLLNEYAHDEPGGDDGRQTHLNLALVVLFLCFSLLISSVQSLVWGELPGHPASPISLAILVIFGATLLRASFAATRLQFATATALTPLQKLHRWDVWILLFGILCLQTMVTKATLLLLLVPRVGRVLRRAIGRLLPAAGPSPAPVTVEELARRIRGQGGAKVVGFYFLMASGFSALMMWQSHAGPFPPSGSGFPKTQTIGAIYTADILFLVWALGLARTRGWLIGVGMTALVVSRHLLPALAPRWFLPSLSPPGINAVDAFAQLFGSIAAPVGLSFGVHALFFALFVTQYGALTHGDAVLTHSREASLRPWFWWSHGISLVFLAIPALVVAILFAAQFPVDARFAPAVRPLQHGILFAGQIVMTGLTVLLLSTEYRQGRSQADQVAREAHRWRGDAGLKALYASVPAARRYGRDRPDRRWDRLVAWYAVPIAVMLLGACVTLVRG